MIFHEDCALNIEHVLFKGSDAIVIGWVKGDAGLSVVAGGLPVPTVLMKSERPDVVEYFGVRSNECFGFALYTSQLKPGSRGQLTLRLMDKKSATFHSVDLEESADYAEGLRVIEGLKKAGLPDDFFQEGISFEGARYRIGGSVERKTAVGHIEVIKSTKIGRDLLIVGWAVGRSPNNFVLKIGDAFIPYEALFAYPRPDIQEAFSKTFGQNARTSGFIAYSADGAGKGAQVQLYYARRSTRTLLLVASSDSIERDVSHDELLTYLRGIHTPELTLIERVRKIDGPVNQSLLKSSEEAAHFVRPDIKIETPKPNQTPLAQVGVIVPSGFAGDPIQSLMSFVALARQGKTLSVHFMFCDVMSDGNVLRELADRAHALFGGHVTVFNGCTSLSFGHVAFVMGSSSQQACFVVDARSGLEFQHLGSMDDLLKHEANEIKFAYSRDVNGVSGTGVTFDLLNQFVALPESEPSRPELPQSRNRVSLISMCCKTLQALANDMGSVPMNELTDIHLLICRSESLKARYSPKYIDNGLPFARTTQVAQSFQDRLKRKVELFTMAMVGV